MRDLTIIVGNRPGAFADVCEAIGHAGVNIEGVSGFASQNMGILHVSVKDAAGARRAIEHIGVKVNEERDVVLVDIEDRPGAAGEVLRKVGHAGVNVELTYMATATRLVVGAQDLDKVQAVL